MPMTTKSGLLLLIILLTFFLVVYCFKKSEGMCSIEKAMDDNDITIFYGSFGAVGVKTASTGDKIIVSVKKNEQVPDNTTFSLYGENGESIIIHKGEDEVYLIVNDDSLHNKESPINDTTLTYYGRNGSVIVTTSIDGSMTIDNYNVKYNHDETSINTFYGPNGVRVDIIRTPDGQLNIANGNSKNNINISKNPLNDYVRKTEMFPMISSPTCQSIDSCEHVDSTCNKESDKESKSNDSTTSDNEKNNMAKRDELILKDNSGNVAVRNMQGNTVSAKPGSQNKIGKYLGDNSITSEPLPMLNNFSSF
jgi:hypothetical protein